jgi:hypothetical protein
MKYKALINMSLLMELKVFAWMFFYKYNAPSELKSLDFINESSFSQYHFSQLNVYCSPSFQLGFSFQPKRLGYIFAQ